MPPVQSRGAADPFLAEFRGETAEAKKAARDARREAELAAQLKTNLAEEQENLRHRLREEREWNKELQRKNELLA
jgi:hypothetical protein